MDSRGGKKDRALPFEGELCSFTSFQGQSQRSHCFAWI